MEWIRNISPEQPVLLAGPTASGKSGLALTLARHQGGVIVNADALQVYANWRVLTARPSVTEEAEVPHRLYGHVARKADYSVGHWLREMAALLADLHAKGLRPIVTGGTGLYFTALTEGLAEIPPVPAAVRAEADARLAEAGPAPLLAELDAATAARIDRQNPARVQRAWEVLRATGRGLAAWQAETAPPLLPVADTRAFVMVPGRDWLNARIDRRFAQMLSDGALEEARAELPHWDPRRPSSRAIGAAELVACLRGSCTVAEAEAAACIATRQYAKRQRTWFRSRMSGWSPLDPEHDLRSAAD